MARATAPVCTWTSTATSSSPQIAIMLNRPGEDFTGGENVFVEQRPRSQSRAIVVKPRLGQGVIFHNVR